MTKENKGIGRKGAGIFFAWILFLLSMIFFTGVSLARNNSHTGPSTLAREHDPIFLTGAELPEIDGADLNEIFVYAFNGMTPVQIPHQVDEVTIDGRFVILEDGLMDGNDELVFMADDAGDWVEEPGLDVGGETIWPTHVITITDPLDSGQAWAYVYVSDELTASGLPDYIDFDEINDRIISADIYTAGFGTETFRNYLTLGDGSQGDLLDRDKLRIAGDVFGLPFSVTEDDTSKDGYYALDGLVRVTRVATTTVTVAGQSVSGPVTGFWYRSLFAQPGAITVPGFPVTVDTQRSSVDWSPNVIGALYFDANTEFGVTIDGTPDVVTNTPVTDWMQVSGIDGTVINVLAVPNGIGSTATYYKDDDTPDGNDTGDQLSYGDAGFEINNVNPGDYSILNHIYFLPPFEPNLGETYLGYTSNPLQVVAAPFNPPGDPTPSPTPGAEKLYLPSMQKDE